MFFVKNTRIIWEVQMPENSVVSVICNWKNMYLFLCKVFFSRGKMFLKKGQNLLTMKKNLLKSIYRDEKTFVFDIKTEAEGADYGRK